MKRTLSLILALLILASSFGCSDNADKPAETTASSVTTTAEAEVEAETTAPGYPEPDLPDVTYNGGDFTIINLANHAYSTDQVFSEEDGDVVHDAVYRRNRDVEEKFEVKLVRRDETGPLGAVTKAHMSGESICDVFYDGMNVALPSASEGYFVDFNTIPYINFDSGYWDKNMAEDLEVAGKLFMMNSDIYMAAMTARFIYFNKTVLELYKLKSPYEYVEEDKWTLDVFGEMCKAVHEDLNGDGTYDGDDRHGLLEEYPMHFLAGAGVKITENDEEGIPRIVCMNERTVSVLEKIASFTQDPNCSLSYHATAAGKDTSDFPHLYSYCRSLFAADHFLFVQSATANTVEFKDMESDYGIAPNPKYDENQDRYYHLVDPFALGMLVPSMYSASRIDMIGMILEYMSWKSSSTLIPAYYETTVLSKRIRDEETPKMLDLVRASTLYEFTQMCGISVDGIFQEAEKNNNLMSLWESQGKRLSKLLERVAKKYLELE